MNPDPKLVITSEELKNCIDQVVLVDVREPEEHERGHLPGCKLIPLGELFSRAEAELNKSDAIVLYCAHGIRSYRGLMILKDLGFENLKSLTGGFAAWS